MDIFRLLAERKIEEAVRRGEFENLPLKGEKLNLSADPLVPPELQMGYKILRNASIIPEELALRKDIASLKNLMDECTDPDGNASLSRSIRNKLLKLNILMERRGRSIALQDYLEKLDE